MVVLTTGMVGCFDYRDGLYWIDTTGMSTKVLRIYEDWYYRDEYEGSHSNLIENYSIN
jgi:hypothetical protein